MVGEVGYGKELEALAFAASPVGQHMSQEDTDMVHCDRPYNSFSFASLSCPGPGLSWSS